MNPNDTLLQASFPSVMVPMRESVAALERPGERLLVAQNGVFLEVVRTWIRVVRQIAKYDVPTPIPYGKVEPLTQVLCPPAPAVLIEQFRNQARAAFPNEVGAVIVWDAITKLIRLDALHAKSSGPGHLIYDRPDLRDGEHIVVDCHSHGAHPAFFSNTDNEDDSFDVKFSFVLGDCLSEHPSTAFRLCAKGIFENSAVPVSWRGVLGMEVA